jgi:hypothetical protein
VSAIASALLLTSCARLPKASSGAAARGRFLTAYASPHGPARGVGSISVRRSDQGSGSARVRWGSNAESLAVVGYAGPSRALDASLRGDSLFIVIRRYGMGVAGRLRGGEEGVSAPLLRFVATPWDFSAGWVRRAVERSAVHESGNGWLLEGAFGGVPNPGGKPSVAEEETRYSLELSARGEPLSLALRRAGENEDAIRVRYGPERNFQVGRIPSWIEWSFSGSVVLLKVEDHAPADAGKIRYVTRAEAGWTILAIDEPGGRALVRWLLGVAEGRAEP